MESNKLEYKLYNKSVVVCTNEWKQPKCHCDMLLGPKSGMAKCNPFWAGHGSNGYVFRASFARLSRTFRSKSKKNNVDTISYLVFRGSSANLSPTCTFLERYLSRKHFKSMPVDLDHIKPFMGFCTTLI